jgi:hypothetical protein
MAPQYGEDKAQFDHQITKTLDVEALVSLFGRPLSHSG